MIQSTKEVPPEFEPMQRTNLDVVITDIVKEYCQHVRRTLKWTREYYMRGVVNGEETPITPYSRKPITPIKKMRKKNHSSSSGSAREKRLP